MTRTYPVEPSADRQYPQAPACWNDAAQAAQLAHTQLKAIKQCLASHGLAPEFHDEQWPLLINDQDAFDMIYRLLCDVQCIRLLLIEHGLADETELFPTTSRWRVDGYKQHARNRVYFVWQVLQIVDNIPAGYSDIYEAIASYMNGIHQPMSADDVKRHLGFLPPKTP